MAIKDSRDKLTREELSKYSEDVSPKPEYVTAAQAQIMIDGILVDECYDIQYSYKEFKEPIFGYNSKHFDAILPGNVIVHGAFTINYKHDAYLYTLLKEIKETHGTTGYVNPKHAIKYREDIKELQKKYKQYLTLYKQNREEKRTLELAVRNAKTSVDKEKEKLEKAQNTKTQIDAAAQTKINEVKANKSNWESELHGEDLEKVEANKIAIKELQKKYIDDLNNFEAERKSKSDQLEKKNKELNDIDFKISDSLSWIDKEQEELKIIQDRKLFLDSEVNAGRLTFANSLSEKKTLEEKEEIINKHIIQLRADLVDLEGKKDILYTDNDLVISIPTLTKFVENISSELQKLKVHQHEQIEALINSDPQTKDAIRLEQEEALALTEKEQKLADIDRQIEIQDNATKEKAHISTQLDEALRIINENIENNIITELNGLKDKIDLVNQTIMRMSNEDNMGEVSERAEDVTNSFNLYIMYNGNVHKILEGCSLTGHAHVIAQGGEPIREYYNFICRRIK